MSHWDTFSSGYQTQPKLRLICKDDDAQIQTCLCNTPQKCCGWNGKACDRAIPSAPSKPGAEILSWSESSIPDVAVATILHYYGYEAGKRCTTQAKLACEAFEGIGVRAWIQDLLGWTKPANPSETVMTRIQLLAAITYGGRNAIAQQMAQQEQYLLEQQQQQIQILARLKAVEVEQDRINTPCGHKYSVVGFANLQGLEISVKEAGTKGRKASALCRKQGIEIERIHDPRFGKVGLYPESILVEVFKAEQN